MTAGAASAQVTAATEAVTTASEVTGQTGIAGYPVEVLGVDGVRYACEPLSAGTYVCINATEAAAAGFTGVGAGTAAGIGLVVVAAAILSNDDETNGTNATNGTNGTN